MLDFEVGHRFFVYMQLITEKKTNNVYTLMLLLKKHAVILALMFRSYVLLRFCQSKDRLFLSAVLVSGDEVCIALSTVTVSK